MFWVTRHKILPSQRKRLQELLGDYELIWYQGFVESASQLREFVRREAKARGCDRTIVIPVLPLGLIRILLSEQNDFEVWWVEMRKVEESFGPIVGVDESREVVDCRRSPTSPTGIRCTKSRFIDFYKLREVKLVLETLK